RYTELCCELGQRAQRRSSAAPVQVAAAVAPAIAGPAAILPEEKPTMLILGAPPRGGNHLLRGLLDNHPQLLLPPDEDYFIRHLSRHPLLRLRGMLVSGESAPRFFRKLQKDGHLERVNAGHGTEVFGSEDSLDLSAYYRYVSQNHKRVSPDLLVRNHVEALAAALGHTPGDGRIRVCFCALQPSNRDLTRVSAMLAQSYAVKGIFLVRDPRAHLASKLVRNPTLDLGRFCRRQNRYWQEIEDFRNQHGPVLRLRFEELVTDTERSMRRVCEFADIDFTPSVLEYTQGGETSQSNSSFAASPGIDREVITRYQERLPRETIEFVMEHCRTELFWDELDEATEPVPA
ncbi:MAG: sulfotransferase, partial [Halioglobus sp.]|nr:sulfotransferase [Halioglobus sp.]